MTGNAAVWLRFLVVPKWLASLCCIAIVATSSYGHGSGVTVRRGDLVKAPKSLADPRYALMLFGPNGEMAVWVIADRTNPSREWFDVLYFDLNGDGDLTEPGERFVESVDPIGPHFRIPEVRVTGTELVHTELLFRIHESSESDLYSMEMFWDGRERLIGGFELSDFDRTKWARTPDEAPVFWGTVSGAFSSVLWMKSRLWIGRSNSLAFLLGKSQSGKGALLAVSDSYLNLERDKVRYRLVGHRLDGTEFEVSGVVRDHCCSIVYRGELEVPVDAEPGEAQLLVSVERHGDPPGPEVGVSVDLTRWLDVPQSPVLDQEIEGLIVLKGQVADGNQLCDGFIDLAFSVPIETRTPGISNTRLGVGVQQRVPIRNGKWSAFAPVGGFVEVESIKLEGRWARVLSREKSSEPQGLERSWRIPPDRFLYLEAVLITPMTLEARCAESGDHLEDVVVARMPPHSSSLFGPPEHPGKLDQVETVATGASPLQLNAYDEGKSLAPFWVSAPGYAWKRFDSESRNDGLRVDLEPCGGVDIRMDTRGEWSVAGMRLRISRYDGQSRPFAEFEVTSNTESLERVPPGTYVVVILKPGRSAFGQTIATGKFVVRRGERADVKLVAR